MRQQSAGRTLRSILLAGVVSAAGLLGAAPASAQISLFRGMEANRPTMTASELTRHGKLFNLTAAQSDAAKELLSSYTTEFEQASKERRDKLKEISEEFQESRDFSVMKQMEPVEEKFQKRSKELETTFLNDFKSLLTEAQAAQWPKFERTRRREKTISDGSLAGESVDLVRIVDELKLDEEALKPLHDPLEQYEVDLDRALTERGKVIEAQGDLFPKPGPGGGAFELNMTAIEEGTKKIQEAGGKVREVNQRYARNIEGLLSEDVRPKFQAAVKRQSFPQVYRASRTAKSFEAALKFDDLDAKQKEAIKTLSEQYARDAETINEKWAQAILDDEKSGNGAKGFGGMMISFGGDENEETPVAQARKAKRELDKKSMDSLKSLLNEKQIEKLPKREENQEMEVGGSRMMLRMDNR